VRLYGRDYHKKLEAAGFKVDCNEMAKTMDPALSERYRLAKEEILYVCRK
jgi:hypothetical protein